MTAPGMLSGLPDDRHAHLVRAHLRSITARSSPKSSNREPDRGREAAVQTARKDIFFASGLDDIEFRQIITVTPSNRWLLQRRRDGISGREPTARLDRARPAGSVSVPVGRSPPIPKMAARFMTPRWR